MATFHAEICVMSHQFLSRQSTKNDSPTAMKFGSKIPMSDHGSCKNVCINYLSLPIYNYFSVAIYFFKAILYKIYNSTTNVFRGQFVPRLCVMNGLLLKPIA